MGSACEANTRLVSRPSASGRCCDEAADVVAKRRARAAEPRREQLGQVDRVAAEQRELAEPIAGIIQKICENGAEVPERERRHDERR
jgi:hypothetical protein